MVRGGLRPKEDCLWSNEARDPLPQIRVRRQYDDLEEDPNGTHRSEAGAQNDARNVEDKHVGIRGNVAFLEEKGGEQTGGNRH